MEKLVIASLLLLTITSVFAQNSATISQTGGSGNTASITQSGDGNSVSINQSGSAAPDGSKPGNRVSLQVPRGTETTINQHNRDNGPFGQIRSRFSRRVRLRRPSLNRPKQVITLSTRSPPAPTIEVKLSHQKDEINSNAMIITT